MVDRGYPAVVVSWGSTRKKDEVDVQFRLSRIRPSNRDRVGEIVLNCEKDREGWLPDSSRFEVGWDESGFVFRRSGSVSESISGVKEPSNGGKLTPRQRDAFEALRPFGEEGAGFNEWLRTAGVARETLSEAAKKFVAMGLGLHGEDQRYRLSTEVGSSGSSYLPNQTRTESNSGETVRSGSPPPRGEPTVPPQSLSERTGTINLREGC